MRNCRPPPFVFQLACKHLDVPLREFILPFVDDDLLETDHKGLMKRPNSFFTKVPEKLECCLWSMPSDVPGKCMHRIEPQ